MSWLKRAIRPLWHPIRVSIALIVLALFWYASYAGTMKRSEDEFKSLQRKTLLQVQSVLKTVLGDNSSIFGLIPADSVLPLEDNLQKPELFLDEDTIDLHQEEGEKEENAVVQRLRTRREKVLEVCRSEMFQDCYSKTVLDRLLFFHHYDTTVCPVQKSASSTWRKHLRRVNGGPPDNASVYKDEIRKAFMRRPIGDVVKDIKSSSKILTVRHPLARLVSNFCQTYNNGNAMTPRRRNEAEYLKKVASIPWSEKFHTFWLPALFANNMVAPNTHLKVGMKAPIDPNVLYSTEEYERLYLVLKPNITFVQYLRFILKTYEEGNPNEHWKQYYTSCCPCYFDYDYITKVETLSEDLEYIFKKLGIPGDPYTRMNQQNRSENNIHSYFEYYRNVPTTIKREILKYIKPDMDLFGYELPKNYFN